MYRLLSYHLNAKTPMYGSAMPVKIEPCKQISKGDACDTSYVTFSNHSGTHIDAPRHFSAGGKSLSQYGIEELIFSRPFVLDLKKGDGELVLPQDLKDIPECDLLLIRTGFYQYRGTEKYRLNNPGISAAAAKMIRETLPSIRAIGIDSISVSSYTKREEGRLAHQALLDPDAHKNKPLLLIEDMDLSGDLSGLKKVFAVPVFFEGVDSMTCTVIGRI